MIEFSKHYKEAKDVALHYAVQLNSKLAIDVLEGEKDVTNSEEAIEFTRFFWGMTDLAVEDQKKDAEVAGVSDLEYCMEKLMNLFIGYLKKMGLNQTWVDESNRINSHEV